MGLDKLSTCAWVSVFFLILLGNFVVMLGLDAQASTNCSRQASSSGDCPTSSDDEKKSNNDNRGNIENQIPSVLPFP
jgi:hypothetical protein